MTQAISRVVTLPIITASGISYNNASIAIMQGASGVGIGKSVSKLNTISEMVTLIQIIQKNLQFSNKLHVPYSNINSHINYPSHSIETKILC